jgi:hypothetical protein
LSEIVPSELEKVPRGSRFHQTVTVLVGLVAVLASSLVIIEADSKSHSGKAAARADRLRIDNSVEQDASTEYYLFWTSQLLNMYDLIGGAQSVTKAPTSSSLQRSKARADLATADYLRTLLPPNAHVLPDESNGVNVAALRALAVRLANRGRRVEDSKSYSDRKMRDEQRLELAENVQVHISERYARRETRAILGLSLAATAAALLGLASLITGARPRRLLLVVAVLSMVAASAWGVSALAL